jgi:tRNA/rRNA methyltransferase
MANFRVVLVNPKIDGNIGAVARVMGNFGFRDLWMVDPCEITEEAQKRAKHANYILDEAVVVGSLEEALDSVSMVVGTSGIVTPSEKHFVRIPITPRELAIKLKDQEGTVAILFGREDLGLFQDELLRCDLLVHVPASPDYPVLNLSHAVAIVLYEIGQTEGTNDKPPEATEIEREKLFEFFADLLDAIGYPEFRREKTEVMFRRMMGRAVPTKWEFYTIMGVLADATELIRRREGQEDY